MAYEPDTQMVNPVKSNGMSTERMAGILVIGALVALIAINRGFRGVSVGGVSVGVK